MDHSDVRQNEMDPQSSGDRPLPTRFGRDTRAAALAGRRHAPRSGAETDEAAAAEVTDDELIFEDRGGL